MSRGDFRRSISKDTNVEVSALSSVYPVNAYHSSRRQKVTFKARRFPLRRYTQMNIGRQDLAFDFIMI